MISKYELVPVIENFDERKICNPHIEAIRYDGPRKSRFHVEYTPQEVAELLEGPHWIWGFNPISGRAELLDRSKIEEEIRKHPKRRGNLRFNFAKGEHGNLHLVRTFMIHVQVPEQYPCLSVN